MQRWFAVQHRTARHFALGIALTGLALTFLAATLLVFPYKLAANAEVQGELLYDLLGSVEYRTDGRFSAIDDPVVQQQLNALIAQKRLNGNEGAAYILNVQSNEVVWQAAATPLLFEGIVVDDVYTMQFIQTATHQLAVQNFWLKDAGNARLEFRMVVALPIH
ncbi:MAG: hypothetical protein QJT81_08305 [Candidatus Thiothrix putei]|jgi:hypothetical protein|uniref:Uncharacterized protein n=2 Tax=Thiothrix TaxID=1030 RepID=A0A1H3YGV9_9GAMM|nr:hypothetical protein [Thiothrix caldifontis]WGZ95969.1 MAG: hypothetical protein QJT81_08305 [Candidatus Thiothrix putei]SEA10776.1 hypothetical protein SAMN05660964_00926 [Thiothrix caldifontis]